MYENPEIMRQLVNERIDGGRGLAAERRLASTARRRNRTNLRARLAHRFGAADGRPQPVPVAKPASA